MNVGETLTELPEYYTGRAPNLLERNEQWVNWMTEAKPREWVLLDKLPNDVVQNNTRVRNRVWRLNKEQSRFEFTSRTIKNDICMFGRSRNAS
jgi:hypothetical protein